MNDKSFKILITIFLITGSLYFTFVGLAKGKTFLAPLIIAVILAMVMAPESVRFQKWGIKKGWAVLFADLVIILFISFMVFLLAARANQVANNWDQIERRLKPKMEHAQNYIRNKLNMDNFTEGQQVIKEGQQDQKQNKGSTQQQQGNLQQQ